MQNGVRLLLRAQESRGGVLHAGLPLPEVLRVQVLRAESRQVPLPLQREDLVTAPPSGLDKV